MIELLSGSTHGRDFQRSGAALMIASKLIPLIKIVNLPKVEPNTVLVDGYIEETLPKYIKDNESLTSVAFIHIDTDTYSPAKVALKELKPYFKPGTIILFDELLGYPNWRNHEFRALNEVLDPSEYEYIGFAHNGLRAFLIKAAIRIL